jgi:hypothetical protein
MPRVRISLKAPFFRCVDRIASGWSATRRMVIRDPPASSDPGKLTKNALFADWRTQASAAVGNDMWVRFPLPASGLRTPSKGKLTPSIGHNFASDSQLPVWRPTTPTFRT